MTAQIRALTKERADLCIADKAVKQCNEYTYLLLISTKLVLIRVDPMCDPTTAALNAGITRIMHHYSLLKSDCSGVDVYAEAGGQLAFQGEICPATGKRWFGKWELWTWGIGAPEFFASAVDV